MENYSIIVGVIAGIAKHIEDKYLGEENTPEIRKSMAEEYQALLYKAATEMPYPYCNHSYEVGVYSPHSDGISIRPMNIPTYCLFSGTVMPMNLPVHGEYVFPDGTKVFSNPGCPVIVTLPKSIDAITCNITISKKGDINFD